MSTEHVGSSDELTGNAYSKFGELPVGNAVNRSSFMFANRDPWEGVHSRTPDSRPERFQHYHERKQLVLRFYRAALETTGWTSS